nr:hypothetical protein PJ912_21490 [Pectobacterium colocasium]
MQKAMEETTWHSRDGSATGGGVSQYFALPGWQLGLSLVDKYGGHHPLQHRGVPDVSGNADPETGYLVEVNGREGVVGGTSAVAPLWAGLLARMLALTHSASLFIPLCCTVTVIAARISCGAIMAHLWLLKAGMPVQGWDRQMA